MAADEELLNQSLDQLLLRCQSIPAYRDDPCHRPDFWIRKAEKDFGISKQDFEEANAIDVTIPALSPVERYVQIASRFRHPPKQSVKFIGSMAQSLRNSSDQRTHPAHYRDSYPDTWLYKGVTVLDKIDPKILPWLYNFYDDKAPHDRTKQALDFVTKKGNQEALDMMLAAAAANGVPEQFTMVVNAGGQPQTNYTSLVATGNNTDLIARYLELLALKEKKSLDDFLRGNETIYQAVLKGAEESLRQDIKTFIAQKHGGTALVAKPTPVATPTLVPAAKAIPTAPPTLVVAAKPTPAVVSTPISTAKVIPAATPTLVVATKPTPVVVPTPTPVAKPTPVIIPTTTPATVIVPGGKKLTVQEGVLKPLIPSNIVPGPTTKVPPALGRGIVPATKTGKALARVSPPLIPTAAVTVPIPVPRGAKPTGPVIAPPPESAAAPVKPEEDDGENQPEPEDEEEGDTVKPPEIPGVIWGAKAEIPRDINVRFDRLAQMNIPPGIQVGPLRDLFLCYMNGRATPHLWAAHRTQAGDRFLDSINRNKGLKQMEVDRDTFLLYHNQNLIEIFKVYDEVLFEGGLTKYLDTYATKGFRTYVSGRLRTRAGVFRHWTKRKDPNAGSITQAELQMAGMIFNGFDKDAPENQRSVNGLVCRSRLDAFLVTFEHELAHIIIDILKVTTGKKRVVHGNVFKIFVYKVFGHGYVYHQLPVFRR